jgi:mono/diheme cytochrome c family protein
MRLAQPGSGASAAAQHKMENSLPVRNNLFRRSIKAVIRLLALLGGCTLLGAIALLVVAPRMNWSASTAPGAVEKSMTGLVLRQWVQRNAPTDHNPLPPTAAHLGAGRREFGEHCAVCHGADGSAHTRLGADFYPPIARLERGAPGWSDGELFFIISNGIRYTGMPGFGARHKPETIWQMILWIRHLPTLTAQERAGLQNEGGEGFMKHEGGGEHEE